MCICLSIRIWPASCSHLDKINNGCLLENSVQERSYQLEWVRYKIDQLVSTLDSHQLPDRIDGVRLPVIRPKLSETTMSQGVPGKTSVCAFVQ